VKDAKIGVLMQNDDYARTTSTASNWLGKDADKLIVQLSTYERPIRRSTPDDPAQELGRQRVLQHHHAQVRRQAIRKAAEMAEAGALPQQRLDLGRHGDEPAASKTARYSHGAISQDPTDPQYHKDKDYLEWKAFMQSTIRTAT